MSEEAATLREVIETQRQTIAALSGRVAALSGETPIPLVIGPAARHLATVRRLYHDLQARHEGENSRPKSAAYDTLVTQIAAASAAYRTASGHDF